MLPNGAPERGMTRNLTGPPIDGSAGCSPVGGAAICSGARQFRPALVVIAFFGILIMLQHNASIADESTGYTDRIAAIVNGAVILESDVKAHKQPFIRQFVRNLPLGVIPPGKWPTEREILEELVVLQLLEQEAARKGVTLDDRAVDASIDSIQKRNNFTHDRMVMFLATNGLSYAQFRKMMVRQFRLTKLIDSEVAKKVPLSEEDAQRYFKENRDKIDEQFNKLLESLRPPRPPEDQGKPEIPTHEEIFVGGTVKLRQITLKVPPNAKRRQIEKVMATAKHIFQEVITGADFSKLARQYSQDSLAKSGGDLGTMQYNSMVPALQKMVQRLRPGDVTPPLQSKEAIMMFYLEDAKGRRAKQVPIPEKMRRQMEERLKQEYERQAGRAAEPAPAADKTPKDTKAHAQDEPAPAADTGDNSKVAGGILTPEEEKEYKKVRDKVITILRAEKTHERMKEWIEQLKKDSIIEVKL